MHIKITMRDFPGGPGVKNLPSYAGNVGSVLGRGTKIPHATGQLSLQTAIPEPKCSGAHVLRTGSLSATQEDPCHREDPTCYNHGLMQPKINE